jgi:cephalosporin-C deacetylase-like acetyl esterase
VRVFLCSVIFGAICSFRVVAQELPIETQPSLDQSNNIRNHLMRVASELTRNSLAGINTLDDWQKVRQQRYREFLEMMGLTDVPVEGPRPPLNVRVVGTIRKPGYRIEKLYYESLPSLYVPANLYIPEGIKGPAPAVLYVCGHSPTQKVHYQAHPRKFAQLGFVCLIIETIQWGEVRGEHWGCYARGWFHWYSRGYNPGGVELWNAIRGLDLLCERPEVDASKLGVTGISGGGAQSWFIAAADPRIKAVAPVCGTSTVNSHIHQRIIDGHCDCMMPTNTYRRDCHDIGALIAPRPLMIASANRDGLNSIEAVQEVYNRTKTVYDLYGLSDNIVLVETPGGHSYHKTSRTKIFSFFLRHLMGKDVPPSEVGDIDESESAMLSAEELKVYVNGPPEDDRTKTIQETFVKVAEPPKITTRQELESHQEKVLQFLRAKTFGAFPKDPVAPDMRWESRTDDGAAHGGSTFSFVSEEDYRLKIDVQWRQSPQSPNPMMVVLRSPGEERRASESFISGLDGSWNIAYLETRGVGETGWSPDLQWHVRRAAAWTGRTVASMRVYDVLRCLQALRSLKGVESNRIAIAARDEMCAVALYAALLDGKTAAVLLRNPPATQNAPSSPDGRGEAIEMLNCLRVTDLPQVAGLLQPTNIVVVGPMPDSYIWAKDLYQTLGMRDAFQNRTTLSQWKPALP